MTSSIVGFKDPRADLHRQSPKIFSASIVVTIIAMGIVINVPFFQDRVIEAKIAPPPVIIHLQNIPETRQTVSAPAPKLGMPLEIDDMLMPDDITIESTGLDMDAAVNPTPPAIMMVEEIPGVEAVEDEIFEFFAVEEPPERIEEVAPVYPEAARRTGIEGVVYVRALVGVDGTVTEASVLKGPVELRDAAIQAVLKTRFTPAKQNDVPVACWVQTMYRFEIN